jgi:hypothetical protein
MQNAFEFRKVVCAFRVAIPLCILALFATPAHAQTSTQSTQTSPPTGTVSSQNSQLTSSSKENYQGRLLFGKNFIRGYTDFELAPPHNEPDLGRCNQPQPSCTAFARYIIGGYLEIQPFARTPLRHAYLFYEPRFFFGDNIPQVKYTYSMAPLAYEKTLGLAIALPKHFELRLTNHGVTSFPPFNVSLGPYDSGPDKEPLGTYNTVGVRWYFGGYDHSSSSW